MSESAQVMVRIRPFSKREKELKAQETLVCSDNILSIVGVDDKVKESMEASQTPRDYSFTRCFGCGEDDRGSQNDVFEAVGVPAVQHILNGYSSSVMGFGATGAGVTSTVFGDRDNPGLLYRSAEELFKRLEDFDPADSIIEVNYMMVYSEQIYDLFVPIDSQQTVALRENRFTGFFLDGITALNVSNYEEFCNTVALGDMRRAYIAMNKIVDPKRAHMVMDISLNRLSQGTVAQMRFVDMSGFERLLGKNSALADLIGSHVTTYDQGASAFAKVIEAHYLQASANGRHSARRRKYPVPYSNSVLTQILQPSLGGTARAVFIACVSPADTRVAESISILKLAKWARVVSCKPKVGRDRSFGLLQQVNEETLRFQKVLEQGKHDFEGTGEGNADVDRMVAERELFARKRLDDNVRLKEHLHKLPRAEQYQLTIKRKACIVGAMNERGVTQHDFSGEASCPCLVAVVDDNSLSGLLSFELKPGKTSFGLDAAYNTARLSVALPSVDIALMQCELEHVVDKNGKSMRVSLTPKLGKTYVDGKEETGVVVLGHGMQVTMGAGLHFIFCAAGNSVSKEDFDYGTVVNRFRSCRQRFQILERYFEVREAKDLPRYRMQLVFRENLTECVADVDEANALALAMKEPVLFSVRVMRQFSTTHNCTVREIEIQYENGFLGSVAYWPVDKFRSRLLIMRAIFHTSLMLKQAEFSYMDIQQNPFIDLSAEEHLIGLSVIPIKCFDYIVKYQAPVVAVQATQTQSSSSILSSSHQRSFYSSMSSMYSLSNGSLNHHTSGMHGGHSFGNLSTAGRNLRQAPEKPGSAIGIVIGKLFLEFEPIVPTPLITKHKILPAPRRALLMQLGAGLQTPKIDTNAVGAANGLGPGKFPVDLTEVIEETTEEVENETLRPRSKLGSPAAVAARRLAADGRTQIAQILNDSMKDDIIEDPDETLNVLSDSPPAEVINVLTKEDIELSLGAESSDESGSEGGDLSDGEASDGELGIQDLIGKRVVIRIGINRIEWASNRYAEVFCRFRFAGTSVSTTAIEDLSRVHRCDHDEEFIMENVSAEFIEYVLSNKLMVEVWGTDKYVARAELDGVRLRLAEYYTALREMEKANAKLQDTAQISQNNCREVERQLVALREARRENETAAKCSVCSLM